jgi:dTDP-4-dehydrorhamnose reductase
MTEKNKILITGSNGLLGQSLAKRFHNNFYLIGCDLASDSFNSRYPLNEYHQMDITQRDKIQRFFSKCNPRIVINTASYTNVDKSEDKRDLCWAANVRSVELLLEAVGEFSPVFVQISTDHVFDGKSGLYREIDKTNPVSYYGHTKLAAEKIIRNCSLEHIIIRSMQLFGQGDKVRTNFALWVIEQLKKGKKIRVVRDQRGNPTFADDLSETIYRLLDMEEYGIFHASGKEECSRLDFAEKIAEIFNLDNNLIEAITSEALKQKAPRPMNSSFNLSKLSNVLNWMPGGIDESLHKLKSQMEL